MCLLSSPYLLPPSITTTTSITFSSHLSHFLHLPHLPRFFNSHLYLFLFSWCHYLQPMPAQVTCIRCSNASEDRWRAICGFSQPTNLGQPVMVDEDQGPSRWSMGAVFVPVVAAICGCVCCSLAVGFCVRRQRKLGKANLLANCSCSATKFLTQLRFFSKKRTLNKQIQRLCSGRPFSCGTCHAPERECKTFTCWIFAPAPFILEWRYCVWVPGIAFLSFLSLQMIFVPFSVICEQQ